MRSPALACSVLMPARNAERTIGETLDSIASQTLSDYEVIVVDDGSTDATRAIVEDRAQADSRIHLLTNPDSGLVAALNAGLEVTRAELVARMDADDIMDARRLELQCQWMHDHRDVAVVGSRVRVFSADGVAAGYRHYEAWLNSTLDHDEISVQRFYESPLAHPSVMFRKHAVRNAGGYRHGDFPEDYELWLRLHDTGARFQKLPEVLLYWRDYDSRTSRSDSRYSDSGFANVRNHYLLKDPRIRAERGVWVCGAGHKTRKRVRPLVDAGMQINGWVDIDTKKTGRRLWGAPVVHYDDVGDDLGDDPGRFFLVMVRSHGAQMQIRAKLEGFGFRIGRDFLPVG